MEIYDQVLREHVPRKRVAQRGREACKADYRLRQLSASISGIKNFPHPDLARTGRRGAGGENRRGGAQLLSAAADRLIRNHHAARQLNAVRVKLIVLSREARMRDILGKKLLCRRIRAAQRAARRRAEALHGLTELCDDLR